MHAFGFSTNTHLARPSGYAFLQRTIFDQRTSANYIEVSIEAILKQILSNVALGIILPVAQDFSRKITAPTYAKIYLLPVFGSLSVVWWSLWEAIWAVELDAGPTFINAGIVRNPVPPVIPFESHEHLNGARQRSTVIGSLSWDIVCIHCRFHTFGICTSTGSHLSIVGLWPVL